MCSRGRLGFWRETEVEARAAARAVGSVVGRNALLECARQRREREGFCVPAEKTVSRDRLKLRHVPRHVPLVQ